MKASLILPTLNEIEGLKATLPSIDQSLFGEIIVVDGRSTDGTQEWCRQQGLIVIEQEKRGMPEALEKAFALSKGDLIVVYTPDGNSKADVLPEILNKLRDGYDLVIASRYKGEATSQDDTFLTGFGNWFFTGLVNFCFGGVYTDTLVAYRGYSRSAIIKMRLMEQGYESKIRRRFFYMNGWELGSSIRASILGLKACEISAAEPPRIGGKSKLSIVKNGFGSLFQVAHDFIVFKRKVSRSLRSLGNSHINSGMQ